MSAPVPALAPACCAWATCRARSRSAAERPTSPDSAMVMTTAKTLTAASRPTSASEPRDTHGRWTNVPVVRCSEPSRRSVNGRTRGLPANPRRAATRISTAWCSPGARESSGGSNRKRTFSSSSLPTRPAATGVLPVLRTTTPKDAPRPPVAVDGLSVTCAARTAGTSSSISTMEVAVGGVSSRTCRASRRVPAGRSGGRFSVATTTPVAPGNNESWSRSNVTQRGSTPSSRIACPLMTSPVLVTATVSTSGWPATAVTWRGETSTLTARRRHGAPPIGRAAGSGSAAAAARRPR